MAAALCLRVLQPAAVVVARRSLATLTPSQLQQAAQDAGSLCKSPVLFGNDSVKEVGTFVQQKLGCAPGTRAVVVATRSGAKRAAIVMHYLRKAGMFPLLFELPDAAPLTVHTASAIAAAKRTGAQLVVGFGSAAPIYVGRACAALIANAGRAEQFMHAAGGKLSLAQPSLPFLAVPTCPGGAEIAKSSLLIAEGRTLGQFTPRPGSVQACLADPSLLSSLEGEPLLSLALANLSHAVEGYARPEDGTTGAKGRQVAWEGVRMAVASLVAAMQDPKSPGGSQGRAMLLASSLCTSATMATGPLGPCRGLALNVASRFNISYSTAAGALLPHVLPSMADNMLIHAENVADSATGTINRRKAIAKGSLDEAIDRISLDDKDGDEDEDWEVEDRLKDGSRTPGGPSPFGRPGAGASGFMKRGQAGQGSLKRGGQAGLAKGKGGASKDDSADDDDPDSDARIEGLLKGYAKAMAQEQAEEEAEEDGWHEEDDEMLACARRWAHVGKALQVAAAAAKTSPGPVDGLPTWADIAASSRGALQEDHKAALEALAASLNTLIAAAVSAGGLSSAPHLGDFGLSEADLGAVAGGAEVDDNTLANLVKLRRGDLLEMLREA